MVRISGASARWLLASLSLLLALLASATATTPEGAYREARSIYDRGDWPLLAQYTEHALEQFAGASEDNLARLRVLRAAAIFQTDKTLAAKLLESDLPPGLRDSEVAVIRLRVLGSVASMAGNYEVGVKRLDEAEHLARKRHPYLAADVVLARTNVRSYKNAEREKYAREALRLATLHHDRRSEVAANAAIARVFGLQERFDEAIARNQRALALAKKYGFPGLQEKIEGNLGWQYVSLGEAELGEDYLRAALSTATKLRVFADLAVWNLQLGNVAVTRRDYAGAEKAFKAGLAAAEKYSPLWRGSALGNLASLAADRGEYDLARRYNSQALEAKRDAGKAADVLRGHVLAARIDRETGRLDDAKATLEEVLAEKDFPFVRWEAATELARVYAARKDMGSAKKLFVMAAEMMDDVRGQLADEETKLAFPMISSSLYQSYVELYASSGKSEDALRVAEQSRARTLSEGLDIKHGASNAFVPERTARIAGVTVLSYWLAPERSFVFVINEDGVQQFPLPSDAKIAAAVDLYQKDLDSWRGTIELSATRGAALYDMLVRPAAKAIRGNRIVIIPDGRLSAFNFETLVVPGSKPHYWIEDVTIETASALQFVGNTRSSSSNEKMLLVGNAPAVDGYPRLPKAAAEIASVAQHFPKRLTSLTGPRATRGAFLNAAPSSYAFIHFVAHGVATRQRPLDSSVILGPDHDGYKLYARDIVGLPLTARLVTISSCHGAGRRSFQGEGLVGLAWAFLRAGAHEVVAALWEVDDEATPGLMDDMYAAIRSGKPTADALRGAKLKLLRSKSIHRKAKYWAPFMLYSGS